MSDRRLTPELLLQAYAQGIFPMAETRDDPEIFWVDPRRRGIVPLDGFHISRSLARRLRRGGFDVAINQDFEAVVAACANRKETWISDVIFDLYVALYGMGHAHSLEIRSAAGDLIGGVYGVTLGGAFFGESMFSAATDGSKIALSYLVAHLWRTGFQLFDAQFITPHLSSLGAVEISRTAYHRRLGDAMTKTADFTAPLPLPTVQDVLHRRTQTS